jgi:hypothetical protein
LAVSSSISSFRQVSRSLLLSKGRSRRHAGARERRLLQQRLALVRRFEDGSICHAVLPQTRRPLSATARLSARNYDILAWNQGHARRKYRGTKQRACRQGFFSPSLGIFCSEFSVRILFSEASELVHTQKDRMLLILRYRRSRCSKRRSPCRMIQNSILRPSGSRDGLMLPNRKFGWNHGEDL